MARGVKPVAAPKPAKRLTVAARKAKIARLKIAMGKAKPKAELSGKELAALMDVSAARFSAMRQVIKGLPQPRVEGKANLFPARAALKAIIAHYDRPETVERQRKATVAKLVKGAKPEAEPETKLLDPLGYKRLVDAHAVTTEQMVRQRMLTNMADVRDLLTAIYTSNSQFLSSLPNAVDPGGKLPPEQRARLEAKCRDQQLAIHNIIRKIVG